MGTGKLSFSAVVGSVSDMCLFISVCQRVVTDTGCLHVAYRDAIRDIAQTPGCG